MNRAMLLFITLALPPLGCDRGDARLAAPDVPIAHATAAGAIKPEPQPRPSRQNSNFLGDDKMPADAPSPEPRDLSAERLLLLLPRGPLIVELRITIDGHPFRAPREELVDELLKAADRDRDGRPTWGEVFADPKRVFGQRLTRPFNMANRKEFMKANDTNHNGLVDRDEARRFVGEVKGSEAAFALKSAAGPGLLDARQSIVRMLLDADDDGVLDREELAALEERLMSRDANDDHIVSWPELDDSLAGDELAAQPRTAIDRQDAAAFVLGPSADWKAVGDAIQWSYPNGESAPSGESWLRRLDADGDGGLSPDEIRNLARVGPQAIVSASFGRTDRPLPKLSLVDYSPRADLVRLPASHPPGAVVLSSAGCRVRFAVDDRVALEAASPSVEGQSAAPPKPTQLSTVYAEVRNEKDPIFSLLDSDHDDRLTTRELRGATSALRGVDADGDGRITPDESPAALVIVVGRGQPPEMLSSGKTTTVANSPVDRPKWFLRMDVNGDREISREEFPGTNAKFRALDLDGDGFIVAGEAQQAEPAARR
ncbi:MAG: hypothetical protein B7Z73_07045 [Planctomycetia bacterium 21-64-5]|nr:MAG: hypothetical protein B7Z73_07045 [Planctomycetia bacterium 21-64-5]